MAHTNIGTLSSLSTAFNIYKSLLGVADLADEKDLVKIKDADPAFLLGLALNLEKFHRF